MKALVNLHSQVHFDRHQFESGRADQKRKLKNSAVPTIFCHRSILKTRKSPKKRQTEVTNNLNKHTSHLKDHSYASNPSQRSSSEDSASTEDEETATPSTPKLQVQLQTQMKQIKKFRDALRKTRKRYRAIVKAKTKQNAKFSRIFAKDQLESLSRVNMKGLKWSSYTVKKALQLRFACGSSGYKLLLQQHYPLPSERTLQRRMESVPFEPGILREVFDYMQLKVKEMKEEERLCCLTLDEMSLTSKYEFDPSSGDILGNVTLPRHSGNADHALVFMLGGITSRWKQTVAYHFTSSSTDGSVFHNIVLDIIQRASNIGLHVVAVTNDMGSANRAM